MSINTVKPLNKSKNNEQRWVESGALREFQHNNFKQSMKKHIPLLLPLALIFAALVATAKGETSYTVNMSGVT